MAEGGLALDLTEYVRDIPDFPTPGIIFKDITPLLRDKDAFRLAIDELAKHYEGQAVDCVLGAEARGFIIGGALAYKLGCGFVPARKPGKLPHDVTKAEYELEYGVDSLEIHQDAVAPGDRVLIVDDVLATGGTASAKVDLVRNLGAEVVGIAFLLELTFLDGRPKLKGLDVFSVLQY